MLSESSAAVGAVLPAGAVPLLPPALLLRLVSGELLQALKASKAAVVGRIAQRDKFMVFPSKYGGFSSALMFFIVPA
jgi:hypothetical protein